MRNLFGILAVGFAVLGCATHRVTPRREALVASAEPQVLIEMTILDVPPERSDVLAYGEGAPGASPRPLPAAAAVALVREAQRAPAVATFEAPSIVTLSGQDSSIVAVDEERRDAAAWTGFKAFVTPHVEADGKTIGLDVRVVQRDANGERSAESHGARLPSGGSILVLGSGTPRRLVVLVSATVMGPTP